MIGKLKRFYELKIRKKSVYDLNIQRLKREGMTIGKQTQIYAVPFALEPYLVKVGEKCTIAADVICMTHDNSIIHHFPNKTDMFGKIVIGDNCFVGARSILMAGITIGSNSIVAAGSVVTKSVPENVVVGGNPAKIIETIEEYKTKTAKYAVNRAETIENPMKYFKQHDDKLVKKTNLTK